jgi:hypothetical protein
VQAEPHSRGTPWRKATLSQALKLHFDDNQLLDTIILRNFEHTTARRVIKSVANDRGGDITTMMTTDSYGADRSGYFHLCSDGALTPQFLICEEDYRIAFNLIGVCAANCEATTLSFSLEDTHLHLLLYGTRVSAIEFKTKYEESWGHHVGRVRGSREGADIELDVIPVDSEAYLMSVGTYTIVQPTKDGKQIMPYDYRWGTGSMYFRGPGHRSLWLTDIVGSNISPVPAGSLNKHRLRDILGSRRSVPDEWLLCAGLLLPDNYVDVTHFERIYRTANCFRVYLASSRNRDQAVQERIAAFRGVALEDSEARHHCKEVSMEMFGFTDVRRLNAQGLIMLAQQLRRQLHLSSRQIASLVRLPYREVCKYL